MLSPELKELYDEWHKLWKNAFTFFIGKEERMDRYIRDIHIFYGDDEVNVVRALEGRIDIYPHKIECVDAKSHMKTIIVLPFNQIGVSIKID